MLTRAFFLAMIETAHGFTGKALAPINEIFKRITLVNKYQLET